MRIAVKSGGSVVFSLLLTLAPLVAQARSVHHAHKPAQPPLQRAVDLIYLRPKQAELQLKAMSCPSAKAYLAFLYLSHKVTIPQSQKAVGRLMRAALAQMPEEALSEIDPQLRRYNMETLLKALRQITEADQYKSAVTGKGADTLKEGNAAVAPVEMFEQYPQEFCDGFSAIYFSSRERQLQTMVRTADDIDRLPRLHAFFHAVGNVMGEQNQTTNGTMVYGQFRNESVTALKVALAPRLYYQESRQASTKADQVILRQFLQYWSLQELWNYQQYNALQRTLDAAVPDLAEHFRVRFKLTAERAHDYANATLHGYCLSRLGSFSHGTVAEYIATPIYKTFSRKLQSVDQIKDSLGQRVMTKEELAQALRLQILNGGSLAVINWLIAAGAPLSGGIEPPLFSAVMRPDVMEVLLKAGARADETNAIGKTALIQAAQYNQLPSLKILLDTGADINHKMASTDNDFVSKLGNFEYICYTTGSRTALMYAAAFAGPSTINYLLSKGADKSSIDSDQWKARQFLQWNKSISKKDRTDLEKSL